MQANLASQEDGNGDIEMKRLREDTPTPSDSGMQVSTPIYPPVSSQMRWPLMIMTSTALYLINVGSQKTGRGTLILGGY